jgi:triacylglycerol lipase
MQASPRNPVLLIHGLWDTDRVFDKMAAHLRHLGWSVHSLDLTPNNGAASLDQLAQQVATYVAKTFPPDHAFDLVGFSMGGIVGRYYLQRLGGLDQVQRFVTIASPHQGTLTAYGSWNYPGCAQMRPTSAFLKDLNRDIDQLRRVNFTSIWSPFDAMILPAHSSRVPVGREVKVSVPLHHLMVTDAKSIIAVTAALAEPLRDI